MTERTRRELDSYDKQANGSLVDELIGLVEWRSSQEALHQALIIVMRRLGAEAGSILFQGRTDEPIRVGPFRQEALSRIQHWENVVSRRLRGGPWRLVNTEVPISLSKVADSQLLLASVPLLRESRVVGVLSLVLPPGQTLSVQQRDLLSRTAQLVGQIVSLLGQLEDSAQQLKQMEVFYRVGQALMSTFDINKLLSDTMQLATEVIDAGAASLMLIDYETRELVFEVSHGGRSQVLRQQRIPLDEGIGGWVAQHGKPVIVNDARSDPRFSHRVDVRTGFLTQSIAAVPLKLKGKVIGVLEVLNKYKGDFEEQDLQLMSTIASQAAIAIENARLHQEVLRERDHIIKAEEDVRRELNRRLHDGPVQLLSAISMSLDHLERLNEVKPTAVQNEIEALRGLVHEATREARNILFQLRPVILETQGLIAAFEEYVEHLRETESFKIHFKASGPVNFTTQTAATLFAIGQEAMNNIRRHARARNVWIMLEARHQRFIMTIRDDGLGFQVPHVDEEYARGGSFGLLNMKERAALLDADLHIESRTEPPQRGTTVEIIAPMEG